MERYFEVVFEEEFGERLLVKADNVIEAGEKAQELLVSNGWHPTGWDIQSITLTKITRVIE